MVKPRTLVTLRLSVQCSSFSLSEHSQVLTFFSPGFALLYAVTYGVYILTWNFGKRNPGVKGSLESLDLNVNRSDLMW